ncbi:aroma-sacti cluster domain-containing protein [Dactylosporangium sp. CA-092794]|uniref:aroma-sacti cluster domain-containing protein n=1 Tax=Dactylosporangium sp. CA-092794 TaxID=3239929 RepID=UPI003D8BC783
MAEHRYTLSELEAKGLAIRELTPEQQDVLRDLTPDELAILVDIKTRLDEVGPDVMAHSEIAGPLLF